MRTKNLFEKSDTRGLADVVAEAFAKYIELTIAESKP